MFLTKWRLFILLSLLPYLISLSSKLFCVGNEPNGVISSISFYKLEAFHVKTFFFKHYFVKAINQMELIQIFVFTKWRLFILSLLLPYLISLSSNLFCESNEPNGVESNICFYKVEAIYPFITATLSDIIIFKYILCRQWAKWSYIKY